VHARRLAAGIAALDGVVSPGPTVQPHGELLDPGAIATNFVLFRVARDRDAFLAAREARGVLMVPYPHRQIRAVTHYGITAEDVDRAVAAVADALRESAPIPAAVAGSVA
jgi:threonine aldolase